VILAMPISLLTSRFATAFDFVKLRKNVIQIYEAERKLKESTGAENNNVKKNEMWCCKWKRNRLC
jgi:hypothetical protein